MRIGSTLVSVLVTVVIAGGTVFALRTRAEPVQPPTTWQYRFLDALELQNLVKGSNSIEEGLNNLGKQGWELVFVEAGVPRPSSVAANDINIPPRDPIVFGRQPGFYFKRRSSQ